jgi:acetate---CoA ligase (ADP-forming)
MMITPDRLSSLFRPRSVALAAVIARVGDLAIALGGDLAALEVNPLRVDGAVIEALDALVTWKG